MSADQSTHTLTLTREALFWVLTVAGNGSTQQPHRHGLEVSYRVTTPPLDHADAAALHRFGLTAGTWTRQGNNWTAPARTA
ncbi:hypothetical protein HUF15_40610 [Streptomyces samsunensis]|uniref:hypothetical protein n=1 Tax=Streptomyces malaysiensis TaxID=92644 RepID=UPI0015821546|nr:hypothetical protein [Streptomyces samsunensis]NUH42923.1 hypothetical protein [Streptomyces samsunensis]